MAPWIERMARVGFVAKGVLYLTIGILSARSAIGAGGRTVTDTHEAMDALHGTFGRPLLAIIAFGLAGYGLWLIVSAFTDAEHKGHGAKGIAKRIGAAVRGIVHFALAGTAASLVLWQSSGESHDDKAQHWTARVLDTPGGIFLVWGVALAIGGYGLFQLRKAASKKLTKNLNLERLSTRTRQVVMGISRFGVAARGVVFVTIAVLFSRAAMKGDAHEAGSTSASMRELFEFGRWPFVAIAVGVAAYGIYELVEARYRRVRAR
ncbi:MAG: DUF1206 domain-containing protein [Deltaproteobacteria bacterium]|nr:DUF1206 domain-containing protein [Deltaproteobacteria bacterium]